MLETMMASTNLWVFLYLIQLFLLSLALGSLTLHQPRLLGVPRLSRFLTGFCITPLVLGAWMLFLAAICPGSSRLLFLFPPPIVALALLALYGCRTPRRLFRIRARTGTLSGNPWPGFCLVVGAVVVISLVMSKLVINSRPPVFAHDALEYLSEALPFAEARSIAATTDFKDSADGSVRGQAHSFLFPAFLSHALLTTGDNLPGYPHDHAARAAFQVTFLYMLLAVVALAGTAGYRGIGALALILLLQVPQFEYISSASSRDAFRIVPLLLLATVLTGLAPTRLRYRLRSASLLPPLVLAAFSLASHTLSGLVVVTLAVAWMIWSVLGRARWMNILLVVCAIGAGLLVSGSNYARAYIETGAIDGNSVSASGGIYGTPLYQEQVTRDTARLEGTTDRIERLAAILKRDQYRLSVPGFCGAFLAIVLWVISRRDKQMDLLLFMSLIVIVVAILFIGLFDFITWNLSVWFFANIRYALHWYPFAAVCVAMLAGYGYNAFLRGQAKTRSVASSRGEALRSNVANTIVSMALVLFVLLVTFSAWHTVFYKWTSNKSISFLPDRLDLFEKVMRDLPAGKKLLMGDSNYNYYLRNQAVLLGLRPTWEITLARTDRDVQDALKTLNIGAVVLDEEDLYGWWDRIPLFSFLSNPGNAFVCAYDEVLRGYVVDEGLVRRQRQLNEVVAGNASESVLWGLDVSALQTKGGETDKVDGPGEKVSVEGPTQVVSGPREGQAALSMEDTTRVHGPPSGLNLSQGSLAVWARLNEPVKKNSAIVRVNVGNDLYIYHPEPNGGLVVCYNKINFGSTGAVNARQWHHYAFTWQDGEQKFYIDGCERLSGNVRASAAETEIFAIGWLGDRDGEQWKGDLAEFVTFDRVLTPEEVMAICCVGLAQ